MSNTINVVKSKEYLSNTGDVLHDITMPLMSARKPYDRMVLGNDWKLIHLTDFVEALETTKRRIEELLEELQS